MAFFQKIKIMIKNNFLVVVLLFIVQSCSSANNDTDTTNFLKPSNLTVTTDVLGKTTQMPDGNGSGEVRFKAFAENATSYKFLINGKVQESLDGELTYVFTASGTNSNTVTVSAYNKTAFVSTTSLVTVFVKSNLIWSDEFEIDGAPNPSKWGYDLGAGGWGNNESQYYTSRPENVIVANGFLKINTIKENFSGSSYTSARILSKDKFSFKYGRVEIRAKLAEGKGTWPALWMLGDKISSVGWPASGEIDIMEHVGKTPNKIYGTLHHPGHSGGNADGGTVMINNASTEFHIYACEWTAASIKFFVDGQLFYSFTNTNSLPFNDNFFLIINTAIGGDFGGVIDPEFTQTTFEVDYVRVYN